MPVWTNPALKDISKIFDYIAQEDEDAAGRVAKKIYDVCKELDKHPQVGRKGKVSDTRELVIHKFPYIVIYRYPEGTKVEVLRVLHAKQKWP